MSPSSLSRVRRAIVGILGVVLLATAAVLWLTASGEQSQVWMSSCVRLGSVMCLLWLAWPELSRLHPWLILPIVAALIAVLAIGKGQFRIVLIALVILIVLARLRPRK